MADVIKDHVEAARGQAREALDELMNGGKRRRLERVVLFVAGFKVGVLITALAAAWWWNRGSSREL